MNIAVNTIEVISQPIYLLAITYYPFLTIHPSS